MGVIVRTFFGFARGCILGREREGKTGHYEGEDCPAVDVIEEIILEEAHWLDVVNGFCH